MNPGCPSPSRTRWERGNREAHEGKNVLMRHLLEGDSSIDFVYHPDSSSEDEEEDDESGPSLSRSTRGYEPRLSVSFSDTLGAREQGGSSR